MLREATQYIRINGTRVYLHPDREQVEGEPPRLLDGEQCEDCAASIEESGAVVGRTAHLECLAVHCSCGARFPVQGPAPVDPWELEL